jgi:hypothetical protein
MPVPVAEKGRQGSLNFPRTETLSPEQVMELFEHFITEARTHDNFLYEIAAWHLSLRGLQMLEDYMHLPPSVEALEGHRGFVDALLTHGRIIWERLKKESDAEKTYGCDPSQVRSNIEWLENKRAMWHQQMHTGREDDILKIFGENPSPQ